MAELWWRLVGFGFRLLYNEMAFTYDLVSWCVSLGAWRKWQRSVFQYLPPTTTGKVLEIAHGTGNLQLDLHAAGYQSIGYDLSPFMGRITQAKLQRQRLTPQLAQGMAQQLPFPNAAFAAVISTFPTSFIFEAATLREIERILQPDGKLIVVLNGALRGQNLLVRFIEWLYHITGQRAAPQTDITRYFQGYGLTIEAITVDCGGSLAQLIVATKK
jgi:ubiquinone/menaquinone biosynthesis C-methylase UbiE